VTAHGAAPPETKGAERVSVARVAFTAALGPIAWFTDLSLRFFLVEFGFARSHEGVVIAIGVFACAIALAAAAACQRLRRRALAHSSLSQGSPSHGSELGFAATLGAALGVFSALVIAAALLPHLYFDGAATP
jgi:hypothetical protein